MLEFPQDIESEQDEEDTWEEQKIDTNTTEKKSIRAAEERLSRVLEGTKTLGFPTPFYIILGVLICFFAYLLQQM